MSKTPSTEEILADIRNKLKMANERIKTNTHTEELNADELEDNTMEALDEVKTKLNDADEFEKEYNSNAEEPYDEESDVEDVILEEEEYQEEEGEHQEEEEEYQEEEGEYQEEEEITEKESVNNNELSINDIINKYKKVPEVGASYEQGSEVLSNSIITAISSILDEKLHSFVELQNRVHHENKKDVKVSELIKDAVPGIMEKWMEKNQTTVIKIISEVAERQISEAISKINKK